MHSNLCKGLLAVVVIGAAPSAFANVVTDWDEKAVAAVTPMASLGGTNPYMAQRMMGMVHAAMFDAVNSIERRYRPYLVQLPAGPTTSKDASAAAAAATVLASIDQKTATEMKVALATYLASIPDGAAKSDGIKLGDAVAAKVLEARASDGSDAPDVYRPRTTPGVYVPTAVTLSSMWPNMKPFVIASPSQFRPIPPISLESKEWATDYNELKDYGGQNSAKRTSQQTETARFWLVGPPVAYHPFVRQLVTAKQMSVVDSARFMTLVAVGLNDAIIAVLDAKYHYNFWRPITAIRNGDTDGNAATDREATWQPIAPTPMHPEYPCAHCIQSGGVAGVIKAVFGTMDIPEIAMTSPTAPGVTHRWTNMAAFTEEIANARIWAGFHYRFSTRVGTAMGLQIGEYVVKNVMQPVVTSSLDVAVAEEKMFAASAGYERFMGRWSRLLAPAYIAFAGVKNGDRVLDVGTGTGSLAAAVEASMPASEVVGVDPSEGFIAYAQKNAKSRRVRFEVGDAQALKFDDASFDNTVALLVMNFVPDENKAVSEMRRVTRAQGTVSACVWDYDAEMQMLRFFWDEAIALDPAIEPKDERHMKLSRQGQLVDLWKKVGLTNIKEEPLVIDQAYSSFNDYWEPFTNGAGPGGAYVVSLSQGRREELESRMRKRLLGDHKDGPFTLKTRAWCVRGEVPKS